MGKRAETNMSQLTIDSANLCRDAVGSAPDDSTNMIGTDGDESANTSSSLNGVASAYWGPS